VAELSIVYLGHGPFSKLKIYKNILIFSFCLSLNNKMAPSSLIKKIFALICDLIAPS
jgi:hypothetical protein